LGVEKGSAEVAARLLWGHGRDGVNIASRRRLLRPSERDGISTLRAGLGNSGRFDPTRFQTEPSACYRASWQLPGSDSHRRRRAYVRSRSHHRPPTRGRSAFLCRQFSWLGDLRSDLGQGSLRLLMQEDASSREENRCQCHDAGIHDELIERGARLAVDQAGRARIPPTVRSRYPSRDVAQAVRQAIP
jgi:hypothetical protein